VAVAFLIVARPAPAATAAVQTVVPSDGYLPIIFRSPPPTPTAVPPPPAGLVNGNFESGSAGWEQYSEQDYPLILPADKLPAPPRSGSWAAWLGGAPNELATLAQVFSVPAGTQTLVYHRWIASADACSAEYDIAGVIMTTDAEVTEDEVIDAFPLCYSTSTNGWARRDLDISSYAGKEVLLIFLVSTDGTLNSNLFLDDVSLDAPITNAGGSAVHQELATVTRQDPPEGVYQPGDEQLNEWDELLRAKLGR